MFRQKSIPIALYEIERDRWHQERSELLNRIQHPHVFQPTGPRTEQPAPDFWENEELAKAGQIFYEEDTTVKVNE